MSNNANPIPEPDDLDSIPQHMKTRIRVARTIWRKVFEPDVTPGDRIAAALIVLAAEIRDLRDKETT